MAKTAASLAFLLALFGSCAGGSDRAATTSAAPATTAAPSGDPNLKEARDFTLGTFDGDTFTLSDHFGELPVVLNFWAPW
jgi:hypothetical protein